MTNLRRKFLKNATKASVSVVAGGLVLVGCKSGNAQSKPTQSSKKDEILYNGNTPYWKEYYANAK